MKWRVVVITAAILIIGVLAYALFMNQRIQPAVPQQNQQPSGIILPTGTGNTGTPAESRTRQVQVFLVALEDNGATGKKIGCGDSLVAVQRDVANSTIQSALTELFSIDGQYYGESGLYNALYQSDLTIDEIEVEEGFATVKLSGKVQLGGTCDSPRFAEQIRETILQFPTVSSAEITINGQAIEEVVSGK